MRFFSIPFLGILCALVALAVPAPATAQDRETPYWASIRAGEVNMRVGPSEEYRIEWVYRRPQLPVKVLRIKEGWRLVLDPEGAQGWVSARLLSPARTALIKGQGLAPIREAPGQTSRLLWNAEPGVVGKLGNCDGGWCELDIGGHKGWVSETRLWGTGEP